MTSDSTDFERRSAPRGLHSAPTAVGLGLLAGTACLTAHETAPPPWALVGDSYALWAAVPLVAAVNATTARRGWGLALLASVGLVLGYYGSLLVFLGRGDVAARVLFWCLLAFMISTVVGPSITQGRNDRLRGVVAGAVGAVFPAEILIGVSLIPVNGIVGGLFAVGWTALGVVLASAVPRTTAGRVTSAIVFVTALSMARGGSDLVLTLFDLVTN